jgi:hypothetical protein
MPRSHPIQVSVLTFSIYIAGSFALQMSNPWDLSESEDTLEWPPEQKLSTWNISSGEEDDDAIKTEPVQEPPVEETPIVKIESSDGEENDDDLLGLKTPPQKKQRFRACDSIGRHPTLTYWTLPLFAAASVARDLCPEVQARFMTHEDFCSGTHGIRFGFQASTSRLDLNTICSYSGLICFSDFV